MAHRALLALWILCVLVVSPEARARGPQPLAQTLAHLVQQAGLGDGVGIHVVRLHDGEELYRNRASQPRNPASNQKLLTAAAALWRLGPSFRAETRFEGALERGKIETLVVRPSGDPTLNYASLVSFAETMRLRGVESIERIVIDEGYFDDEILPPAFDQQPAEAASFRAAISALSIDRNSYLVYIKPGFEIGGPAQVRVLADGYVTIDNDTKTTPRGPPTPRIEHELTEDGHLAVHVEGNIPSQVRTLHYRRRVPDPRAYAASVLVRALRRAGIEGALQVEYASAPDPLPLVGTMPSPALATMLAAVGKWSDNFTAEMLLKILGAEAERPGTSARGVEVVREELAVRGVDTEGLVLVNGSGLFDGNHVAPRHITETLVAASHDPSIWPEYVAQLAVGGSEGTLQNRLKDLPNAGMVRAKTGTLRDVIALSGYVLGDPDHSVAFSFLANGIAGRQREARDLADAVVRALADYAARPSSAENSAR